MTKPDHTAANLLVSGVVLIAFTLAAYVLIDGLLLLGDA